MKRYQIIGQYLLEVITYVALVVIVITLWTS